MSLSVAAARPQRSDRFVPPEQRDQGRVVQSPVALGDEGLQGRGDRLESGQRQPDALRLVEHDARILGVDIDSGATGPEGSIEHPPAMDLEDATRCIAAKQGLTHQRHVEPAQAREGEGLRDGLDRRTDEELVAGFGDLTRPDRPEVDDRRCEGPEHGSRAVQCGHIATGHERQ